MTDPEKFRELQDWADTWWSEEHGGMCSCGAQGLGPRHHEVRCLYFGWAWELKARDLLRGAQPGADPARHQRKHFPAEVG